MSKRMSKAELKRRLVPGTKLTMVNSLLGDTRQLRTVKAVRSASFIMTRPDGRESYLATNSGDEVFETDNGFKIVGEGKRVMVEYEWGWHDSDIH